MNKNAEYQKTWRERNPETHKQRMREQTKRSVQKRLDALEEYLTKDGCHKCGDTATRLVNKDGTRSTIRKKAHATIAFKRFIEDLQLLIRSCEDCYQGRAGAGNRRKDEVLGMAHGTACGRLRKQILFDLVKETNRNLCYRCGNPIKDCEDLTIEHKIAWLDKGAELFWDLKNIAFSHKQCNRPRL